MDRKYMIAEDSDGNARDVRVDQANWQQQKRDLEAQGFNVQVLSEDERIDYGLMAQDIARQHAITDDAADVDES